MASRPISSNADPPAVLLGGAHNALSVARSLGRSGVEVYALADPLGIDPARHSRYVAAFVDVDSSCDVQSEWEDWLRRGPRGAVLLPCSDDGLELVARRRQQLVEWGYAPVEANDEVLLALLDKERTYELARRAGVDAPRAVRVSDLEELRDAARDFTYPCALKPLYSHRFVQRFHHKGVIARDPGQLEEAFVRVLPTGLAVMVTEIVQGDDDEYCSYYSYVDEEGEPLLHFTKRKLRQYPVGFGSGSYHVSVWEPEAAEIGMRLFSQIGLRGLGNVEFKRDRRDGRLKLIECNPRFTAANELVRLAGIDLARLAYRRALGEPVHALDGSFAEGVRQWHPVEDVRAFLDYRRQGRLTTGAWLQSLAHRQHLPVFSWDDPMPTLAAGWAFPGRARRFVSPGPGRARR